MTAPKPLTPWQEDNTPASLPRHVRRNIAPGDDGCWLWTRSLSRDGYGWASLDNRTRQAHRLVYSLVVGDVPEGKHLDHLCRVRHCVNPDHLEPVTNRQNLERGDTPAGWASCQTCGGPFSQLRGQRRCIACMERYEAGRRERKATQERERRARKAAA